VTPLTGRSGNIEGDGRDHASETDAAQERFKAIAGAIAQGYSLGPSSTCAVCRATLIDFDSKSAGFCERCAAAIEAHKVASK
jgi:hypothetical protein